MEEKKILVKNPKALELDKSRGKYMFIMPEEFDIYECFATLGEFSEIFLNTIMKVKEESAKKVGEAKEYKGDLFTNAE